MHSFAMKSPNFLHARWSRNPDINSELQKPFRNQRI